MISAELIAWYLGVCNGISAGFLLGTMATRMICARQMRRQALAAKKRP